MHFCFNSEFLGVTRMDFDISIKISYNSACINRLSPRSKGISREMHTHLFQLEKPECFRLHRH
jgi:hypothetical protein